MDYEKEYRVTVMNRETGAAITTQWFDHLYAADGYAETYRVTVAVALVWKHEKGRSVLTDTLVTTYH